MVRRWSCVSNVNVTLNFNLNFLFSKKRYKFINFKSSVSLKRFNKKYTKFKRKAFNRLKHANNWAIYHNVFKEWSKNYNFFKKMNKLQFVNHSFYNNYTFFNFTALRNSAIEANPWPFIFINRTDRFNRYLMFSMLKNYYNKKIDQSPQFFKKLLNTDEAQTDENFDLSGIVPIFFFKEHGGLLYSSSTTDETISDKKNLLIVLHLSCLKFKISIEYYQILLKLIFINII